MKKYKDHDECLTEALKLAYKYSAGDLSVGTSELRDYLCSAICERIGDSAFCDFVENEVCGGY